MRRERKVGPFIPCEVRAQTGQASATTPVVARRCRQATTPVGAWAKARSGDDVYAQTATPAPGRQRLRPRDDKCRMGGVFFHKHPKLQRSGDNVCVRATTLASRHRRLDPVFSNLGIFLCFGNPNKTFPLSLFENYSNCVEDGNPKLFLLVGVFLSALNCDLAFLSRHL